MTHTSLNQIVNKKRSVTGDITQCLSKALGITAEFWMILQARYDLNQTRDESGSKIDKAVRPLVTS
ncbi:MAG: hypothetical protein R3220_02745 [Balneolaceae bacterium]|nr:hypothetical protein [Balneolaceae bacterium]